MGLRKVEAAMLAAIRNRKVLWERGNTRVQTTEGCSIVKLHGNTIARARVLDDKQLDVEVDYGTLRKWPTATTLSRLRALGVQAHRKAGEPYVNGLALYVHEQMEA